ncbi:MAG: NADH-quinone oxidoreductase subunit C, partial [Candidatus Promineifilaceae bacterium]
MEVAPLSQAERTAETDSPAEAAQAALQARFPGVLSEDMRERYTGLILPADQLPQVAGYLRHELGFNYLSSLTAADLIDEQKLEVIYHTFSIDQGGGPVVLKVQVDRNDPVVPSLTPEWPGADFQEREAWDLYGIGFDGHPDLRRILLWEGFHGHP